MIDDALLSRLEGLSPRRALIAIAGAPGSGKSTFADSLCAALNIRRAGQAAVLPMDGYHLDNALLDARGWRPRKGAPHTFDVDGLARDLDRLRTGDKPVLVPVFDRALDLSRGAAREIGVDCPLILVEGNYLLLRAAPWDSLLPRFDLTIFLQTPENVLHARLIARWLGLGLEYSEAAQKVDHNDMPNARLIHSQSNVAEITLG
jgi:pantothenate kinase